MKKMGRPLKTGLIYFPITVNIFTSRKMKRLMQAYQQEGVLTYIALLCSIYGNNGYFIPVTANLCFDLSFMLQIEEAVVYNIIDFCVKIDLFDQTLFLQEQILTSSGIQKRYLDICKRSGVLLRNYVVADNGIHEDTDTESAFNFSKTSLHSAKSILPATEMPVQEVKTQVNADKVDYNAILTMFNSMFDGKLPRIISFSDKRKGLVKHCIDVYGLPSVEVMFRQTLLSPFLQGENEHKWSACFDWLFHPDHYIKVLEGYYIKQVKNETNTTTDPADCQRKAGIRAMAARAIANDRHP